MALEVPDGYAQIIYEYALTGSPHRISTTIGVSVIGEFDTAVGEMHTAWVNAFTKGSLSNAYSFVGTTGRGAIEDAFFPGYGIGTSGTAAAPPQVAALVKKVTSFRGRKNRGRMYLPGGVLTDAGIGDDGSLSDVARGNLQAQIDDFRIAVDDATGAGSLCILHTDGSTPTLVQNLVVDTLTATQRRRIR